MTNKTEKDLPNSLEELCDYIVKWSNDIVVREQFDGKWGAYTLSELPAKLALKWAMTFIKERTVPHRIVRDEGIVRD